MTVTLMNSPAYRGLQPFSAEFRLGIVHNDAVERAQFGVTRGGGRSIVVENLTISDEALDMIGAAGFDPVYGARPLKRAIQQQLENPLAQKILTGDYKTGDQVQIDVKDSVIVFD